jgi:hypothetical protein
MQLLEDSIGKFKKRLAILIGADNSAPSRRKEGKAVWKKTKEAAKKKRDTELLTQMGLVAGRLGAGAQRTACDTPVGTHGAKAKLHFGSVCKDEAREGIC